MSQSHTMFAGQAIGLAELFNLTVGKKRLEGVVSYTPRLSTPDGPSTAGGRQALQHLTLVPEGGGATILIGTANLVEQQAELRTFAHVDELHRQRFKGVPFQIDRARYDALLESIRAFLGERKYAVTLAEAPRPAAPFQTRIYRPSPLRMIITMALSAAVVLAVAALFLRR
jgi:hypothetical protein